MLIRFELENWQSFRSRTEFSFVASRERQHSDRLPRLPKLDLRVLPVAAVYGANASGKSNLFRALGFARALIVDGTQTDARIRVEPFRLGRGTQDRPTRFRFEILADGIVYEFGFAVDATSVREEWLLEITSGSERPLYRRRGEAIEFGPSLSGDAFLEFAHRGTRDNQLFLTNAVSQKVDRFKPVYDWFRNGLVLVSPESTFGRMDLFVEEGSSRSQLMDEMLERLDTGIVHLEGEELDLDGMRVVAQHRHEDGSLARFEIASESAGTRRILDLLPAFLDLAGGDGSRVYVIDELDRSLHTLLTRRLLEMFLAASGPDTRGQLLFSTHDLLLMDQSLMRRDEMWVTERNGRGESTLIAFSDYKDVRYDKDIRKSYLQGRLGGVPRMWPTDVLPANED
jgi:AAA15 family ATPase/GTPase